MLIACGVFFVCEQKLNDESILRSQLDMKMPHHSVSGRSYLASSPDSSNIAVYEVSLLLPPSPLPPPPDMFAASA